MSERAVGCTAVMVCLRERSDLLINYDLEQGNCVCERMCEMHSEGWLPGHAVAAIDTKQKLHVADVMTFPDVLLLDYNLFHLMPIKGCFN